MFTEMKKYHDQLREKIESNSWNSLTLEQRLFSNEFHILNQYNDLLENEEIHNELDRNYIMVLIGIRKEFDSRNQFCITLYEDALKSEGVVL